MRVYIAPLFVSFVISIMFTSLQCKDLYSEQRENLDNNFLEEDCDNNISGRFSYYALVYSWSPEWCRVNSIRSKNEIQCTEKRSFIIHGLWPQCNTGYPQSCKNEHDNQLSISKDKIYRFMPSDYLIDHEWSKHGTCSGLSKTDYYLFIESLYDKMKYPELKSKHLISPQSLKDEFIKINNGLKASSISLSCDSDKYKPNSSSKSLDEIRICFDKNGNFTQCENMKDTCMHLGKILITK